MARVLALAPGLAVAVDDHGVDNVEGGLWLDGEGPCRTAVAGVAGRDVEGDQVRAGRGAGAGGIRIDDGLP
jgi:hypothetical protein